MPDDKDSREKQAADRERRQRRREVQEELERADEAEPGEWLGDLDDALETHDYPTTTTELIEAYGDAEVETRDGYETLEEVFAPVDGETYDSADDVRNRILRLVDRR